MIRDDVDVDALEALRTATERDRARRHIAAIREELAQHPTGDMVDAMQEGGDE